VSKTGANAETIRRGIELFNQGKIPELMALYHPEVEVEATGTVIGGAFRGKEGLAAWFGKIGSTYPKGVHLHVENLIESGDTVVAEWSAKGTLANGKELAGKAVSVFEFRDGKASKQRYYADSEQIARLMGQL